MSAEERVLTGSHFLMGDHAYAEEAMAAGRDFLPATLSSPPQRSLRDWPPACYRWEPTSRASWTWSARPGRKAEGPVTIWTAKDIDVDPEMIGLPGSPTVVDGVAQAKLTERKHQFLAGTSEEEAQALVERLRPYL